MTAALRSLRQTRKMKEIFSESFRSVLPGCIIHRWWNLTSSYLAVWGLLWSNAASFTAALSLAAAREWEVSFPFFFCSHISIHFSMQLKGDNWGPHQIGLKKRVHWSRRDLKERQAVMENKKRGVQRDGAGEDGEAVGPWNMSIRPRTWCRCSVSQPVIRWYLSLLLTVMPLLHSWNELLSSLFFHPQSPRRTVSLTSDLEAESVQKKIP